MELNFVESDNMERLKGQEPIPGNLKHQTYELFFKRNYPAHER
ncbi:MAG: hypothetical protein JWO09_3768 [Bacteroidetes bacterium]|nr:hypothetical protein [Bacteroidota bacterium]